MRSASMTVGIAVTAAGLFLGSVAEAQNRRVERSWERRRPEPAGPPVGSDRVVVGPHGGHDHTGSPYRYGYAPFEGGYGYGYDGVSIYAPGGGFNHYHGPAGYGPLIGPPVYAFPPFGYGYGPTFGYGSAYYPVGPDPLNNQLLQQQYNADWRRLSQKAADLAIQNQGDPLPGTGAVPLPSSPEAKIRSLRFQSQGDEAFRKQDYQQAWDRYKQAASTAKDQGGAYFRVGYALVALGRYSSAVEYFKRGLAVEPTIAITGPNPDELYGDNQLAWTAHLGRVTQWVREDVRDADRVFLLGLLLYYDGDTRSREFLENAWRLSGGDPAVARLLNPPKVEGVEAIEPTEGANATAEAESAEPVPSDDLPVIPVPPANESGNSAGPIERPSGEGPLFPLPSEQKPALNDAAAPPLPAPAD